MANGLFVTNEIILKASAGKVWDALTNPEKTKQYMFGCETVSDWQPGSELLWRMVYEGKEMIAVKGHIVEIHPDKKLVYTVFDPNSTLPDIPENYLTVVYELVEDNGATRFTITQGDFSKVANGEKRYQDAYNKGEGWNPILLEIKKLVEADVS